MKKFFLVVILFSIGGLFLYKNVRESVRRDLAQPIPLPTGVQTPQPTPQQVKGPKVSSIAKSLFVPYWGLGDGKLDAKYDKYLYFGITPGKNGIDRNEAGFNNIDSFIEALPRNSEKQIVVRMIDSNSNFAILKDPERQKVVINDSFAIAKDNGFSGIVLDLEISAVPFDSLVKQINDFTNIYYTEAKNKNIKFSLMFYGDSFYRLRPFDVKVLSRNADDFLIMAYDFSKARGNPGPNFPLNGKETYGYDMTRMTENFLQYLPPEKTSVVFGLFGYDWTVDDKGNALTSGKAKTYLEIKKEFLNNCKHKECVVKRKNDSSETEINYTDENKKKHIVWFEGTDSVMDKERYLKSKGISNFSFWAYSYF